MCIRDRCQCSADEYFQRRCKTGIARSDESAEIAGRYRQTVTMLEIIAAFTTAIVENECRIILIPDEYVTRHHRGVSDLSLAVI